MDGMTINHIVSIDHGSFDTPQTEPWLALVPRLVPSENTLWYTEKQFGTENGPFVDGQPAYNGDFPWQSGKSPEDWIQPVFRMPLRWSKKKTKLVKKNYEKNYEKLT